MDERSRFLAALERRGLLGMCGRTRYGEPVWRAIEPAHEPQTLMAASVAQRNIVACAHATSALKGDYCAGWVEDVFAAYGICITCADARELYERYCCFDDTAELKVGMVVAVPRAPYTVAAARYGHVGLYIGDARIMDCASGKVRTTSLELWLSNYGVEVPPRWGWLGDIALG